MSTVCCALKSDFLRRGLMDSSHPLTASNRVATGLLNDVGAKLYHRKGSFWGPLSLALCSDRFEMTARLLRIVSSEYAGMSSRGRTWRPTAGLIITPRIDSRILSVGLGRCISSLLVACSSCAARIEWVQSSFKLSRRGFWLLDVFRFGSPSSIGECGVMLELGLSGNVCSLLLYSRRLGSGVS